MSVDLVLDAFLQLGIRCFKQLREVKFHDLQHFPLARALVGYEFYS